MKGSALWLWLMISLCCIAMAGCDRLSTPVGDVPGPSPTSPSSTEIVSPVLNVTQVPVLEATRPASAWTLTVWLPPNFSQGDESLAGAMMLARLRAFDEQHPEFQIETRIKALEGPGGLLDSLTTASVAAPLALPDLVALPRPLLETAALKGLVYPLDDLTAEDSSDWFEYARALSSLQSSRFGLPFAGDALLLVARQQPDYVIPTDWDMLFSDQRILTFPASDADGLFPLLLYQAVGGDIVDDQGRPALVLEPFTRVLLFFQSAAQAGIMPFWLTQYESWTQAWQDFQGQKETMTITWASNYFLNEDQALQAGLIPLPAGTPSFSLATGWVWALANPQPERRQMSLLLAEYLLEEDFLARWTQAAGLLPTSERVLRAWNDETDQQLAELLVQSAVLYPSADVLSSLGPVLRQATIAILKQETDPVSAAQDAVNRLQNP